MPFFNCLIYYATLEANGSGRTSAWTTVASSSQSLPWMILHEKLCSTCWQLVTLAQVVIALSGGELIYFELSINGQLLEVDKKDLAGDVACLDVAPVPEGRQRSRFLAVASYDSTVTFHLFGTLTLVLQAAVDLAPSATEPGQVIFLEYRQAAKFT